VNADTVATPAEHEAQKRHRIGRAMQARFLRMQPQPQRVGPLLDGGERAAQPLRVVVEHQHVVAITHEVTQTELRRDQMGKPCGLVCGVSKSSPSKCHATCSHSTGASRNTSRSQRQAGGVTGSST